MAAQLAPGVWELEKSENFDEYMKAIGVSYAMRQIGNTAKPRQEISIKDGVWTIITSTSMGKTSVQFELNKEFTEITPDGRKCRSICSVEGNKLITKQKSNIDSLIVRDFRKNNCVMTLSANGVTSTRLYTRMA